MNQENEIEVLGFWWVLGHSEEKFPGRLKYSNENGAVLEIFHDSEIAAFSYPDKTITIIYGVAESKVYTLYNCFNNENSVGKLNYYFFDTDHLFIHNTAYLDESDGIIFDKISVRLNNCNEFFNGLKAYKVSRSSSEEGKYSIDSNLSNIDFEVNESFKGCINTGYRARESFFSKNFNIEGQIWLSLESFETLLPIHELLNQANFLRMFFSIVTGSICTYEEIDIGRIDINDKFKLNMRDTFGKNDRKLLMFDYEEVQDNFSNILTNWFYLSKEIPEVIQLFYDTHSSPKFYEYHFRNSYAALEGLFQWKKGYDTEGKNVISILLSDILKSGTTRTENPIFLRITKESSKWSEVARNNRHYQVHLNKVKYAQNIVNKVELLRLTRKIQAIILFYILNELGLSNFEINRVFGRLETYFLPVIFN